VLDLVQPALAIGRRRAWPHDLQTHGGGLARRRRAIGQDQGRHVLINSLAGISSGCARQGAISGGWRSNFPPPDTKRWTIRCKAAVVQAVRIGAISLLGACLRYGLSVEEFLSWQRVIEGTASTACG
jgi:hypothetical protein